MLIKEKIGSLNEFDVKDHIIDCISLEWYETNKRILHKKTKSGKEVSLKFFKENQNLTQDDVIYKNENYLIVIDILPCEVIIVYPGSMHQMATLCYEIGNKHLPLFYEDDALMLPFEEPVYRWLLATGFEPKKQNRKLLNQLRTSIAAHGHSGSLFSKILQFKNSSNA